MLSTATKYNDSVPNGTTVDKNVSHSINIGDFNTQDLPLSSEYQALPLKPSFMLLARILPILALSSPLFFTEMTCAACQSKNRYYAQISQRLV